MKYELVEKQQSFGSDILYKFYCKENIKKTILTQRGPILEIIPAHLFTIKTYQDIVHDVSMRAVKDSFKNIGNALNINGFNQSVYCSNPPYYKMQFTEKDFPKFLDMFWQSKFLHYYKDLEEYYDVNGSEPLDYYS